MLCSKARPRDRIVDTARDLFRRHGIKGVGVDAIAEAAGTNKMTLYRHFGSKDELIAECLREQASLAEAKWAEIEAAYPEPRARLHGWVRVAAEIVCGDSRPAPAKPQSSEPRTPPFESAVIVRCTRSRCTNNPSSSRSSGASVRSRTGQMRCADENFRTFTTRAVNALRVVADGRFAAWSAEGANLEIAVPTAYRRPACLTNFLT